MSHMKTVLVLGGTFILAKALATLAMIAIGLLIMYRIF